MSVNPSDDFMYGDDEFQQFLLVRGTADSRRQVTKRIKDELSRPQDSVAPMHVVENVGPFVQVQAMDWKSHATAVRQNHLGFNPAEHNAFDYEIKEVYQNQALSNKNHPDYAKMEVARTNIAVLRNTIANHFMPTGEFDDKKTESIRARQYIGQVGFAVADILRDSKSASTPVFGVIWKVLHPFSPTIDLNKLNAEGEGAKAIYEALKRKESMYAIERIPVIGAMVLGLFDRIPHKWNLPDIEQTPFSKEHLMMQPEHGNNPEQAEKQETAISPHLVAAAAIANAKIGDLVAPRTVEEALSTPVKRQAIAEARYILENMRVDFGNMTPEKLKTQDADAMIHFDMGIKQVRDVFVDTFQQAMLLRPDLAQDPHIAEAATALMQLMYINKQNAYQAALARGDNKGADHFKAQMEQMADKIPGCADCGNSHISELLFKVQKGLDSMEHQIASVQNGDLPAAQRSLAEHDLEPAPAALIAMNVEAGNEQRKATIQNIHTLVHHDRMERHEDMKQERVEKQAKQTEASVRQAVGGATISAGMTNNQNYDTLLGGMDLNGVRNSMNAQNSGQMVQPNSAKTVIEQQKNRHDPNKRTQNSSRVTAPTQERSRPPGSVQVRNDMPPSSAPRRDGRDGRGV